MPRRRPLEKWYKNRIKLLAADSWRFWTRLGFFFFLFHTLEVLSLLVVRDRWIAFSTSNLSAFSKATLLLSGLFTGIAAVVFLIFWLGNVLEIDMILSETPDKKRSSISSRMKLSTQNRRFFNARRRFDSPHTL